MALVLFPAFLLAVVIGFSKSGTCLSLLPPTFLIGFQAFRIPVELLIRRAVQEGIAPRQMTWTGLNLDILPGISALLLFPVGRRIPRWGILVWNTLAQGASALDCGCGHLEFAERAPASNPIMFGSLIFLHLAADRGRDGGIVRAHRALPAFSRPRLSQMVESGNVETTSALRARRGRAFLASLDAAVGKLSRRNRPGRND
ncbi:MAG: hypothetical protein ABI016_08860 [Chthoniobacterales bacterium]